MTGHIKSEHYSNYLMVSKDGKPLSTVNVDRANWYLERNLAKVIDWPDKAYPKVIQLNFQHKGGKVERPSDIIPVETQCVVCGSKQELSLHHVVPQRVKKFYPGAQKNHTRHLCVLLCEKHHKEIEVVNDGLIENPAHAFQRIKRKILQPIESVIDIFRKVHMRYWIWKHGGITTINKIFIDKFVEMKPKYLPKGWL